MISGHFAPTKEGGAGSSNPVVASGKPITATPALLLVLQMREAAAWSEV
jgi:hypothetical protein